MHRTVEQTQALRQQYGEQHFQVQHYLALWKSDKSEANWKRLIGAVLVYKEFINADERLELLRRGKKVYDLSYKRRIQRYRIGPRGGVQMQTFGKCKARWQQWEYV
jgi:hypothetical protein